MIKKSELIRLFYKNNINSFFNNDNIENLFKPVVNSKIELNFGKDHCGVDCDYNKIITYIVFCKDDKVIIGKRDISKYSIKLIHAFEMAFKTNKFKCSRDGIVIETQGDYETFFKRLNLLLNMINGINDLLVTFDNARKTPKIPELDTEIVLSAKKLNYKINTFLTEKGTLALKINYDGNNKDTLFLKEINLLRNSNLIRKQDGNTIEFKENTTKENIIDLLKVYGWEIKKSLDEEFYSDDSYNNKDDDDDIYDDDICDDDICDDDIYDDDIYNDDIYDDDIYDDDIYDVKTFK